MALINSLVLVISFLAASNVLATPHVVRHHHRAIVPRLPAPAPALAPLDVPLVPLRKRQNSRRCKQKSSSVLPSSTPAVSPSNKPATTPGYLKVDTPTTPTPTPTSTTVPTPKPTTTQPSQGGGSTSSSSSNLPSFMVGTQTGQGTFYSTGLGACGITNTDTDYIAAASHLLFDNFPNYLGDNPNKNPMCGRKVIATYKGKSVTVTLTDRCAACAVTDLDFSPSAFKQLADFGVGRISGMTWVWV